MPSQLNGAVRGYINMIKALKADSPTLAAALATLPFANVGVVHNETNLTTDYVSVIYLEPEAPEKARWAWADGHITPFKDHRYVFEGSTPGVYSNTSRVPPLGIRSAPPLGGLAAGSVELRADGTLRSWTLENASPAGSTKTAWLDAAALGVRISGGGGGNASHARLLRTHPPSGLPGVQRLAFSGASPFSRLVPSDAALPPALDLTVYGRSRWRVGDMAASALPAVAFTITAHNPSAHDPLELAFFLSLPIQLQTGMVRASEAGAHGAFDVAAPSATACAAACIANSTCVSWNFVNATSACTLTTDATCVPPAANSPEREFEAEGTGLDGSGVRGRWRAARSPGCLTLERAGTHAAAGTAALCAAGETTSSRDSNAKYGIDDDVHITFGTAPSLHELWAPFDATGSLDGAHADGLIGAAAASLVVPPGANASVTISLGWHFPHRDFMGTTIGNQYAHIYKDAEEAAAALLEGAPTAVADVDAWAAFASAFTGPSSSLPTWLGDSILNTLHHARSAFWLSDGRFRQWESFSCVNVDSVHNDGERHLPYLLLWPEILPSKMHAWAAGALADGMVQEQLACGCMDATPPKLDAPCGRVMGDVSSMFIVYLYEYFQWGPVETSSQLVKPLWPAARKAAAWQMARANRTAIHLPDHLVDTYDGLSLQRYNASSFSAFFHLLAMRAAAKLARLPYIDDEAFATECDASYAAANASIQANLWVERRGFYRAYTNGTAVMADSLYAQVLADSLGLGALTSDEQVRRHLKVVASENGTPYGLLAMTGRYPYPGPNPNGHDGDNSVWMMANANWATLSLWRGGDVGEALAMANQTLGWWRSGLNDMWNVVALHGGLGYGLEGQPLANSHYGYHLVIWHTLYALSGQHYSAPHAALSFAPRLEPPYELPVLVPGTAAVLTCKHAADSSKPMYTLRVLAGKTLRLEKLSVGASAPAPGILPIHLAQGEAISW